MLDCSNIQTTGRLNCNQKLRILIDLTGNDCFLLVSTRKIAGINFHIRCFNLEILHCFFAKSIFFS